MAKLKILYYVETDGAALARRTASHFVETAEDAVARRGVARIAISGGSTPKAAFQLLADSGLPWRERMPWEKLELYWVDERTCSLRQPRQQLPHDAGWRCWMPYPLKPEQIHRMEGEVGP